MSFYLTHFHARDIKEKAAPLKMTVGSREYNGKMMKASVMTADLRKLNVGNKSERGELRTWHSMHNAAGRHHVPQVTRWVAQSRQKQESVQLTILRDRANFWDARH